MINEIGLLEALEMLLGGFLSIESSVALFYLSRKHRPLWLTKYAFSLIIGIWLCIDALIGNSDWLDIGQAAALSAFVASHLVWRLDGKKQRNELI